MQAQLAYVKARLSILKHHSLHQSPTNVPQMSTMSVSGSCLTSVDFGQNLVESSCFSTDDNASFGEALFDEVDMEMLARELLTNYLTVTKVQPSWSP